MAEEETCSLLSPTSLAISVLHTHTHTHTHARVCGRRESELELRHPCTCLPPFHFLKGYVFAAEMRRRFGSPILRLVPLSVRVSRCSACLLS